MLFPKFIDNSFTLKSQTLIRYDNKLVNQKLCFDLFIRINEISYKEKTEIESTYFKLF